MNPILACTNELELEVSWLKEIIAYKIDNYYNDINPGISKFLDSPPKLTKCSYSTFVEENKLSSEERLLLILAMVPYLDASVLRVLRNDEEIFEESGVLILKKNGKIYGSGLTFLWLIEKEGLNSKFDYIHLLQPDNLLFRKSILEFGQIAPGQLTREGPLQFNSSFLSFFTTGQFEKPHMSEQFPAQLETTDLEWDDLFLEEELKTELQVIKSSIEKHDVLKNEWKIRSAKGFKYVFYGPSGTGKTLAATLLGKYLDKDVYKVNLSRMISKYVGETIKNIHRVLSTAEHLDAIVFVDEAESLFANRSNTNNNSESSIFLSQNVGFMLSALENFSGILILSTNKEDMIDSAFNRRFKNRLRFAPPGMEVRKKIWEDALPDVKKRLDPAINLKKVIEDYGFSPASIYRIVENAATRAISKGQHQIAKEDMDFCISKERMDQREMLQEYRESKPTQPSNTRSAAQDKMRAYYEEQRKANKVNGNQ